MAKRVNTNAYEMAPINPGWIKKIVPEEYADDGLRRIVLFYVINTICADLSSSSIEMKTYGWSKDVWKNSKLKNRLYDVANLKKETLIAVKSIGKLKEKFETAKADLVKKYEAAKADINKKVEDGTAEWKEKYEQGGHQCADGKGQKRAFEYPHAAA